MSGTQPTPSFGFVTLAGNATLPLQAVPLQQMGLNIGRNLIHNPKFNVWQRGNGPFTSQQYTADRWDLQVSADAVSVVATTQTDAGRTQIGDESSTTVLNATFTGTSGAGAYTAFDQPIELVRRLSGKTITVSFYAATAAGPIKVGINVLQNFGTGGSPSANAFVQATGVAVTASPMWGRYTATFALPSAAGRTLGTNGNDDTAIWLWLSSGATNGAFAGNVGVQSGQIFLWGVQAEIGSAATPLEGIDPVREYQQCQRFYQVGQFNLYGYNTTGSGISQAQSFPQPMRATPAMTPTVTSSTNASGITLTPANGLSWTTQMTATVTGPVGAYGSWTASADL